MSYKLKITLVIGYLDHYFYSNKCHLSYNITQVCIIKHCKNIFSVTLKI